jgi:hypothetical protein
MVVIYYPTPTIGKNGSEDSVIAYFCTFPN